MNSCYYLHQSNRFLRLGPNLKTLELGNCSYCIALAFYFTLLHVMSIFEMDNRLYQQLSTGWTYRWRQIIERVPSPRFMVELSLFILILLLFGRWWNFCELWLKHPCQTSVVEQGLLLSPLSIAVLLEVKTQPPRAPLSHHSRLFYCFLFFFIFIFLFNIYFLKHYIGLLICGFWILGYQ